MKVKFRLSRFAKAHGRKLMARSKRIESLMQEIHEASLEHTDALVYEDQDALDVALETLAALRGELFSLERPP